jgi:hypothetical protein
LFVGVTTKAFNGAQEMALKQSRWSDGVGVWALEINGVKIHWELNWCRLPGSETIGVEK